MHPAEKLAAYLAANPQPDFSVVDALWAEIEEQEQPEQSDAPAAYRHPAIAGYVSLGWAGEALTAVFDGRSAVRRPARLAPRGVPRIPRRRD